MTPATKGPQAKPILLTICKGSPLLFFNNACENLLMTSTAAKQNCAMYCA